MLRRASKVTVPVTGTVHSMAFCGGHKYTPIRNALQSYIHPRKVSATIEP